MVDASASSSSSAPDDSTAPSATATPLQLCLGALILGASAGLTFYTKRTGSMLKQMERVSKNAAERRGPPKNGPKTKLEYEKTRSRWEKDDL